MGSFSFFQNRVSRACISRSMAIITCTSISTLAMSGCTKPYFVDPQIQTSNFPPMTVENVSDLQTIVFQAPNPGWSLKIDKQEHVQDGRRVFITLRRPNPVDLYPQQIVEKRIITQVRTGIDVHLVARVLDHDESTKGRAYAPVDNTNAP